MAVGFKLEAGEGGVIADGSHWRAIIGFLIDLLFVCTVFRHP
jgi:hypothetical protein